MGTDYKDKAERQEAQKVKLQALPDLKHTLDQRWVQAKHAQVDTNGVQNAQPLISAQALKQTIYVTNEDGSIWLIGEQGFESRSSYEILSLGKIQL